MPAMQSVTSETSSSTCGQLRDAFANLLHHLRPLLLDEIPQAEDGFRLLHGRGDQLQVEKGRLNLSFTGRGNTRLLDVYLTLLLEALLQVKFLVDVHVKELED